MKILPLVSICIPVYNGSRFVSDAVNSAISQSYDSIEVIAYDNASTDETVTILNNISSSRLRVISDNHHVGMADNWNRAIKAAEGDMVLMLSADDQLTTHAVKQMMEGLLSSGADIAFGKAQHLNEGSTRPMEKAAEVVNYGFIRDLERYVIDNAFPVNINSVLAPKEDMVFDECAGLVCDLELLIRWSQEGKLAFNNQEDTVIYRVHDQGLSSNKERMWRETLEVYHKYREKSSISASYSRRIFNTLIWLKIYLYDSGQIDNWKEYRERYHHSLSWKQKLLLKVLNFGMFRSLMLKLREVKG